MAQVSVGKRRAAISAVLFDVDGVLIDTAVATTQFVSAVFSAGGVNPPEDTAITERLDHTLPELIARLAGSAAEAERLTALAWSTPYPWEHVRAPDGLEEEITALGRRFQLGAVSSRRRRDVDHALELVGIRPKFAVVVGFGDYSRPKPDPEPLLVACRNLRCVPESCVYVGDSQVDVAAARAAGCASISVGRHTTPEADGYAVAFADIRSAVDQIVEREGGR